MKTNKLIYVVDDEAEICKLVSGELQKFNYTVRTFQTGSQAQYILRQQKPDLMIVDLGLPDMDGLNLIRQLGDSCKTGVIILSGRNSLPDRVLGLELGADDYISKPFDPRELLARTNSILRRMEKMATYQLSDRPRKQARFGGWNFNPATLTLSGQNGSQEILSTAEAELLLSLLKAPKQILSREQLLPMRHDNNTFDRCIDVRMSRIRKKLETDPKTPNLIKTVYGAGYMLMSDVDWH
ncbi:MAG: response regulator transcription factor [Thiothrix sp.]